MHENDQTETMMPSVILASRNAKKIAEMQALLAPQRIDVLSVADFPNVEEVDEDGQTFAENAGKKARETSLATGHWCIGEDSGLCVEALQGAPGIYSARFSGPQATDAANNALLLEKLRGIPPERRGAHYVCHIAVADPSGAIRLNVEAICRGRITDAPRGNHGFGYDPYFQVCEYHRTFGELDPIVKQQLSHRARAFQRLIPQLVAVLDRGERSTC